MTCETVTARDIGEALYHGEAVCDGCGTKVDLSECDDVEEATERWNEHVRSEQGEPDADLEGGDTDGDG